MLRFIKGSFFELCGLTALVIVVVVWFSPSQFEAKLLLSLVLGLVAGFVIFASICAERDSKNVWKWITRIATNDDGEFFIQRLTVLGWFDCEFYMHEGKNYFSTCEDAEKFIEKTREKASIKKTKDHRKNVRRAVNNKKSDDKVKRALSEILAGLDEESRNRAIERLEKDGVGL